MVLQAISGHGRKRCKEWWSCGELESGDAATNGGLYHCKRRGGRWRYRPWAPVLQDEAEMLQLKGADATIGGCCCCKR